MNYLNFLEWNRKLRTKLFQPLARFLLKLKFTANRMTFLSFLLGLACVYFLFQNYLLFFLFGAFHLLADGLDGVLARLTKISKFGSYFDFFTDRTIFFLILIKLYLRLNDYYILIIAGLAFLQHLFFVLSKFEYPVLFFRTSGLVYLAFSPLFLLESFLTFGYLVVGALSLFILLLQLKTFLRKKSLAPTP